MTAVVSLGSNLGDRASHLNAAIELLRMSYAVRAVSPYYETEPVGAEGSPPFLNAVVVIDTHDAYGLLDVAHRVEDTRGRLRSRRWGPRTLDVDVVAVAGVQSHSPLLTLPHPRAHERAFVLKPWLDLDPDAEIPGHGRVADLLQKLGADGIRRWSP